MGIVQTTILAAAVTAALASIPAYAAAPPVCGDVNGSGAVMTSDALLVLRSAVGEEVDLVCASGAVILRTGQTFACGPGSDGDLQAGAARSFTDNGDGTVTDNATGLMWEKKDRSGGIHDMDAFFTWSSGAICMDGTIQMDGTMVNEFLAEMNGGTGFAGYDDWRIPNQFELFSLLDLGKVNPATPSEFDTNCTEGCTVLTCSCTRADYFWSSTTFEGNSDQAWSVSFGDGLTEKIAKVVNLNVRAVRMAY